MISVSEEDLICDFVETYHILDYRALPPTTAGVLAVGLRDNSRIKMRMAGQRVSVDTMINAIIADRLGTISWQLCGDEHLQRPESIFMRLNTNTTEQGSDSGFDTPEEYEAFRKRILNHE